MHLDAEAIGTDDEIPALYHRLGEWSRERARLDQTDPAFQFKYEAMEREVQSIRSRISGMLAATRYREERLRAWKK